MFAALIVTGCGLPHDQRGSLDEIRGGRLVAATAGPEAISDEERMRLQAFAERFGAELALQDTTTHDAMAGLERTQIHIIAGLPGDSPYSHAGRSRTYRDSAGIKRVWAVPPGENALLIEINRFLAEEAE